MASLDVWETYILPYLDVDELLALRLTSKDFKYAVDHSIVWRKRFYSEFGVPLVCDTKDLILAFLRRRMAKLYRIKFPHNTTEPLPVFLKDISMDWTMRPPPEAPESWLGRVARMAGMTRQEYTSTPFAGKTFSSAGINVYGCVSLTTSGELACTPGEFAFLRGNHKIRCPSGGRFVSLATSNLMVTAIGDDGALYMYKPGQKKEFELVDRLSGMTFYKSKGTMFGNEIICSCSHGLVAIKADQNMIVTVQAYEGKITDFALFYGDKHRVVYATEDGDLHYIEISMGDFDPFSLPINLGNVKELTGLDSKIVRLEASPNSYEFWAIDESGRCFVGEFSFYLDFPLTKFEMIPGLKGVCDVVIGHMRQDRYAHTWDGKLYPLQGDTKEAFDCLPIAKVVLTVREALVVCLPPEDLFAIES